MDKVIRNTVLLWLFFVFGVQTFPDLVIKMFCKLTGQSPLKSIMPIYTIQEHVALKISALKGFHCELVH